VLVVILGWKRMWSNRCVLFAAHLAPINPRVRCGRSWLMKLVKGVMRGLLKKLRIFIERHLAALSRRRKIGKSKRQLYQAGQYRPATQVLRHYPPPTLCSRKANGTSTRAACLLQRVYRSGCRQIHGPRTPLPTPTRLQRSRFPI